MKHDKKIEEILSQMTLKQKIGQTIVVGMSGTMITNDLREAICKYECGGIRTSPFTRIFRYFSDDKAKKAEMGDDYTPSMQKIAHKGIATYNTPEQYAATLNELKELAAQRTPAIPLHIVLDQEGDTSRDFTRGGVVQFPSNMGLTASGSTEMTYKVAKAVAKEMKASGFDMIHSPVVDVNINPLNPEIGRRAFSDDPQIVADHAVAMLKGFKEEGIIAAAKHFPGRGDSATDAHFSCPKLDVSRERLDTVELYPYKKLIEEGIDSIMVAHCIYPALDKERIATVSPEIVTGLLRNELGFKGLITTDSITMGALIDKYGVGESCARALKAGADLILMKAENQWRGEMFYTIEQWVKDGKITEEELDAKMRRILKMKFDYGMFENMGKVKAEKAADPYTDSFVTSTAKDAAEKAMLVCKDKLGVLPFPADIKDKKVLLINQMNSVKSSWDAYDHPALFQEMMEEAWPSLQTFETHFGLEDESEEASVMRYVEEGDFDLVICTNFYDRSAKPHNYPGELIAKGFPVLLLTNTPYHINKKGGMDPEAPSILLNMNLTPQGYRAMHNYLFGKGKALGVWPINNYDPLNLKG